MRRLSLVAVVACACGPGLKTTEPSYRNPKLHDFAAELTDASHRRDTRGIRQLLGEHVTIGGMWFEDVRCMAQFAAPGRVEGAALDELARCLATLDLAASSRVDALPDVVVLTYGAGLEVEARFIETRSGPWLNWIGYVARRDMADALPTVSGGALEAHRLDGDSQAPLAGPGAFDELAAAQTARAWLKVCIDSGGAVTGVHVREASSPRAARAFAAAAQTWKFQPFVLRGQPTPVCAMMLMRYPVKPVAREVLPLPLPADAAAFTNVPASSLGERLTGTRMVVPHDSDKRRIAELGITLIVGAVHYCVDETGHVNHTSLIRSTGVQDYDRRILTAVRGWVYEPYRDDGQPIAVCSSVHFIYSQRGLVY